MLFAADNTPDTLFEQCAKFVVKTLDTLATVDPFTEELKLRENIALPSEICEKLLEVYQQGGNSLDDRFAKLFSCTKRTILKRVRLRNAQVSDDGLKTLLNHNLLELDICNCTLLTKESQENINSKGQSLVSLSMIDDCQAIMGSSFTPQTFLSPPSVSKVMTEYEQRGYILKTPKLRRLVLHTLQIVGIKSYFKVLLKPMTRLTHLDLSGCIYLGDLTYLENLKHLVSLTLHNVFTIDDAALGTIEKLSNLRHLDISQMNDTCGVYKNPNIQLASLVENLPHLVSLDISGTNLAGRGVAEHSSSKESDEAELVAQTDIPGLRSRVDRPFEFLGLYLTHHAACRRHDIPAKKITGNANEEQTLHSALFYMERPRVLQKVLNDLYHLFRYENCVNVNTALSLVLEAMDRHLHSKPVQISGSATLFYIVKSRENNTLPPKVKRQIISTLLTGMSAFKVDETMMRNGCLTLCQFKIPMDVLCDYERLVRLLLHIVVKMEQESFVQRIGIYLLNSLACQVDGAHKQLLGDMGTIDRMLKLIENRVDRRTCDDVLEVAWSTMWNVTDETAVNCERFLENAGMDYFLACLKVFHNKEELLRNMMGLLGNVAEVSALRPRLMKTKYIGVFADLLDSNSDGIEVSYNAAGVLAHICSDRADSWSISEPSRESVLAKMVNAIRGWNLSAERNINYRSFEPILGLLSVEHTAECQLWAVWALANLTKVYPSKYCGLVESEGGLVLLEKVKEEIASRYSTSDDLDSLVDLTHPSSTCRWITELADFVISNCQQYKDQGYLATDAPLDG